MLGLPRRRAFFGLRREFTMSRGVQEKWYTGRLHPEVRPLTVFDRKVPPFVYHLLINDTSLTHQV